MSVEFMQKAFEISASDKRLTPADKLVLLRWAWKTRDAATPYEIKFRTVARELGLDRNTVRASVGRLVACGYLSSVSVKVVAGPAFQCAEGGASLTPQAKKGGVRHSPVGGCATHPQKGEPLTPFKKKKIKEGPAALNLSFLGRYGLSCLREGKPLVVDGVTYETQSVEYRRLLDQLRQERV